LWFRNYFCRGLEGKPILVLWPFSQTPTRRRLREMRVGTLYATRSRNTVNLIRAAAAHELVIDPAGLMLSTRPTSRFAFMAWVISEFPFRYKRKKPGSKARLFTDQIFSLLYALRPVSGLLGLEVILALYKLETHKFRAWLRVSSLV
jgi:hypothetical protein